MRRDPPHTFYPEVAAIDAHALGGRDRSNLLFVCPLLPLLLPRPRSNHPPAARRPPRPPPYDRRVGCPLQSFGGLWKKTSIISRGRLFPGSNEVALANSLVSRSIVDCGDAINSIELLTIFLKLLCKISKKISKRIKGDCLTSRDWDIS